MKKVIYLTLLIIFTLISVLPLYIVIMMSTHTTAEIFSGSVLTIGSHFIENMKTIIENNFAKFYINSMIVSTAATIASVLISAFAGFALAKYEFKLKKYVSGFILATMMIPGQIGLIGYVLEMRTFGLINTRLALILVWLANSFGVFFMMQYIKESVPDELLESARIDGCSDLGTFFRIVLPLIRPGILTLSMLIFLWSWNNFLLPLITIFSKELYTIPLGIKALSTYYVTDFGAQGAGLAFAVIPMIVLFSIGAKYFISGLTAGAVKG